MSAASKRKTKPKATRKTTAKPRAAKKRAAPTKKIIERSETPVPQPTPVSPAPKAEVQPAVEPKTFILALRLKGSFGTPIYLVKALETLRLDRRFNAVLLENKTNVLGMLRNVKDYVTWGELKTPEIAKLLKERGELQGGATVTDDTVKRTFGEDSVNSLADGLTKGRINLDSLWAKGLRPVFRLRPPSGGFERSIKRPYGSRGELGARGTELSELLERMI
ncbi:MAG TPA: 50S ribosomal protein L30 [Candidatus Acidoferrales bacterium]|nr:50S ribosomal protein L30 [Candidatus Acidoferrales bacterium]